MATFGSGPLYDYTDLNIVFDGIGTDTNLTGLSDPITISIDTPWPTPLWTDGDDSLSDRPSINIIGTEWLMTSNGYNVHVMHAFAQPASPRNAVQLSLYFMLIVIVSNVLKMAVMGLIVLKTGLVESSSHLVTCGDAVASFLACPDPNTRGLSTAGRAVLLGLTDRDIYEGDTVHPLEGASSSSQGHVWTPHQSCLGSAVPSALTLWWLNLVFIASSIFLGYFDIPGTLSRWGTSSNAALVQSHFSTASILLNAWLPNTLQLFFSFTYFNLNGIFTSMALAKEWSTMASQRKGLRVSHPERAQRSTYFLQLPYRWAIPLTVGSGFLHWLTSQTIYLVQFDVESATGQRNTDAAFVASGFSTLSLFVLILALDLAILSVYIVAMLPLQENIPLGASCSAIISAACHPPDTDTEAHLKEVRWGVTDTCSQLRPSTLLLHQSKCYGSGRWGKICLKSTFRQVGCTAGHRNRLHCFL